MKICENCGKANWEPDNICDKCGKKLGGSNQQAPIKIGQRDGITEKKRLHDEYPWSDIQGG